MELQTLSDVLIAFVGGILFAAGFMSTSLVVLTLLVEAAGNHVRWHLRPGKYLIRYETGRGLEFSNEDKE